MTILSLSSQVAMGHVGNSATAFALQRLGHAVWQVPTIVLSHHPGHGSPAGVRTPSESVEAMLQSILARETPQAVFSGYLAEAQNGVSLARHLSSLCTSQPTMPYILDPVIGDNHTGRYVSEEVAETVRSRLLPLANICLPNCFELGFLSGIEVTDATSCRDAALNLISIGPRLVLCTSAPSEAPSVATELHTQDAAWRVSMAAVPEAPHGTGDLFAGVFMAKWLEGAPPEEAMGYAAGAVHAVAAWSRAMQMDDLALIAAQHALSDPPLLPEIERLV